MANHLRAFVKHLFEEVAGEFHLARFTDVARNLAPHVGDEDDVLQGRVTAKLAENLEISSRDSGESFVRDTMDVGDPCKLGPFFVSV